MSRDSSDGTLRTATGRTNKHHVFPSSRIRNLPNRRQINKLGVNWIDQTRHDAFHNLFQNRFPWEVHRLLKDWAYQLRMEKPENGEGYFFKGFTTRQFHSFQLLFGCTPQEFRDNGHLSHALEVVSTEGEFYSKKEGYQEAVRGLKSKKK